MDLKASVYEVLLPIGIPVTHIGRPKKIPGVSYHFFGEKPSLFADGEPVRDETNCQVDIWTNDGNSRTYASQIRRAMRAAGFRWTDGDDFLENETGLYHQVLIFYTEYQSEKDG